MSTILFLLLGTARLARSFPLGEVLSFLKGVSLARFNPCLTHEVTPFFPFCLSLLQLFHTHKSNHRLAISVQMCYIACMSKQYNTSEQSEEQQKTKERIIAAASKVLAEKGYEATTLREISREAQAAPGLVHYYFGGKDELLVEVLQAAGRRFHQSMEHLVHHAPADRSLEAVLP